MHLLLKSLHISQSEINISCHRSTWDIIGDYPKEPRISCRTARSNYPEAILRKISIRCTFASPITMKHAPI